MRKAKAIDLVVAQLGNKDEEIQKAASGSIASIVDNDFNNQNTARKAGAVKLLVAQLGSKNDSGGCKGWRGGHSIFFFLLLFYLINLFFFQQSRSKLVLLSERWPRTTTPRFKLMCVRLVLLRL